MKMKCLKFLMVIMLIDHIYGFKLEPAYAKIKLSNTNEWSPLQKNDPLKDQVVNDYIPPVLQNVQYWAEKGNQELPKKSSYPHPKFDYRYQTFPQQSQMHYYMNKRDEEKNSYKTYVNYKQLYPTKPTRYHVENWNHVKKDQIPAASNYYRGPNPPYPQHSTSSYFINDNNLQMKINHQQKTNNMQTEAPPQIPIAKIPTSEIVIQHIDPKDINALAVNFVKEYEMTTKVIDEKKNENEEEKKSNVIEIPPIASFNDYNNIVIEGHSRVKTYGSTAEEDELSRLRPRIRFIEEPQNPIVIR